MHEHLDRRGVISVHEIPASQGVYAPYPTGIPDIIRNTFIAKGIEQLYAHQTEAIGAALAGQHLILTTSTSSGKSVCYTIPILSKLVKYPLATAIYTAPTKALSQNQLQIMSAYIESIPWPAQKPVVSVVDGDTPFNMRKQLLNNSNIIITTPDFMHASLLPKHHQWAQLFANLEYVAIDEAHILKGVFGTNCAHVFRRLRRICSYYGSQPVSILCTATIANPNEFAYNLTGQKYRVISGSSAPTSPKKFVFYEPPTYVDNTGKLKRRLTHYDAARAMGKFIENNYRVITFCRSRKLVESTYRKLSSDCGHIKNQVGTYKGSYSPDVRRQIEEDLFTGNLKGIISTNALEIGINIGDLDTCLLAGFPGSISSTWQQAGRVGRSGQKALIVLLANDDPLDHYLVKHPQYFLGSPCEKAIVSPNKLQFIVEHLVLAAMELPLSKNDVNYWGQDVLYKAVNFLRSRGDIYLASENPKSYATYKYLKPSGLRGESENFDAIDPAGKKIEKYDYKDLIRDAYPGAILPVRDTLYMVRAIDFDTYTIQLDYLPGNRNLITIASVETNIINVQPEENYQLTKVTAHTGVLTVRSQYTGHTLIDLNDGNSEKIPPLQDLKPVELTTTGLWLDIPTVEHDKEAIYSAVHGLKHLLHIVLPFSVMADRNDLGTYMEISGDIAYVYIYDQYNGGVGLAESALYDIQTILERCYELVNSCGCKELDGCPGCIQLPQCTQRNEHLNKYETKLLLACLLGKQVPQKTYQQQKRQSSTLNHLDLRLDARRHENKRAKRGK